MCLDLVCIFFFFNGIAQEAKGRFLSPPALTAESSLHVVRPEVLLISRNCGSIAVTLCSPDVRGRGPIILVSRRGLPSRCYV